MRKKTILAFITVLGLFIFYNCDNNEDNVEPDEFEVNESDFSGFMNWELEASNISSDSTGFPAHGINNPDVVRDIYVKDGQDRASNGNFPIGTMIVKHSRNPNDPDFDDVFTAMVKRGGSFNPDDNGWEWFMIKADGSILVRTAVDAVATAGCSGCHNAVANDDYVFSK